MCGALFNFAAPKGERCGGMNRYDLPTSWVVLVMAECRCPLLATISLTSRSSLPPQ